MVNPDHDDFPALLAEAIDVLHAGSFDPQDRGSGACVLAVAVDQALEGGTACPDA